jgi:dihydropyrimidinase
MSLLITEARVITASDDRRADVLVDGETIVRIEPRIDPSSLPSDTEIVDGEGKYLFPGFIDPHVHVHLPFMGTHAKDDWDTVSKAALAGGTTTLIEMVCPGPTDEPLDAFEEWHGKAAGTASVDFTFHMGVVRFEEHIRPQLREIVKRGVASFKVFLAYKGALDLGDEELFGLLSMASELGVITTAHCENAVAVDAMQRMLIAAGRTGPEWHEPSRPVQVEAEGVHHLCTFAELTGAHVYAVHTSCAAAVRAAIDARLRGVNVWIEAVAPHLVLDRTYAERDGFEGAKYVMSPPLREKANQDTLWNAIRAREIATVGTDHAPFDFTGQKVMGQSDFTKIPNGIPSVQERIDLMHTHGVCTGRIDLNTMVDACSTQAARIFGLYPRKGTIAVGSDADLVLYDPKYESVFSAATSRSAVDYNAFEGWPRRGRCELVTVRGRVHVRDGALTGAPAHGQFLQRAPTHFGA